MLGTAQEAGISSVSQSPGSQAVYGSPSALGRRAGTNEASRGNERREGQRHHSKMGKVREASWRPRDISFCDLIRRQWRLKVQAELN